MDLQESYGFTDPALEENGVEVQLSEDAYITVRRSNNQKFKDLLTSLRKPYEQRIQRGTMDQKVLDQLTRQAVAKEVLIGWRGIKLDGKEVKYSPAKAEELLKKYEDFQEDVLTAANTRETFRRQVQEENEKNS
jgi:hypothetical protein